MALEKLKRLFTDRVENVNDARKAIEEIIARVNQIIDYLKVLPAGGGGGGAVTSVFGRVGAVVSANGDYSSAQVGAVPVSHLVDADPHTQYQKESERNAISGYAGLDATALVPTVHLGVGAADATKFLRGDRTWQSGLGGTTFEAYDHEWPPAAADARDDEFSTAVIDAKWTLANWPGPWTYDIDTTVADALIVRATNAATINILRGLLQAIPAGDFTIVTAISLASLPVSYAYVGLIMTTTNTGNSGSHLFHGLVQEGNSWSRYTQTGTNFAGMSATLVTDANLFTGDALLRIRRVGANYFFGYSLNGPTWMERQLAPGFVPAYFGIGCLINGAPSFEATYKYFRYSASGTATFGGKIVRTKG